MLVAVALLDPRFTSEPLQIVELPSGLCAVAEPSMITEPLDVSGFVGEFGNASTVEPTARIVRLAVRSSLKPSA